PGVARAEHEVSPTRFVPRPGLARTRLSGTVAQTAGRLPVDETTGHLLVVGDLESRQRLDD
ncbi:MAG: hypothetical protein AAB799_02715, partial [Patescibacteria group bacterium]